MSSVPGGGGNSYIGYRVHPSLSRYRLQGIGYPKEGRKEGRGESTYTIYNFGSGHANNDKTHTRTALAYSERSLDVATICSQAAEV